MEVAKRMPRLLISEWRELERACTKVGAVVATIGKTNIQAAPAILQSLGEVYELMARMYNRGERAIDRVRAQNGLPPFAKSVALGADPTKLDSVPPAAPEEVK